MIIGSRSPGAKARLDSSSRVCPTLRDRRYPNICGVPNSPTYLMGRARSHALHGLVAGLFRRNPGIPKVIWRPPKRRFICAFTVLRRSDTQFAFAQSDETRAQLLKTRRSITPYYSDA